MFDPLRSRNRTAAVFLVSLAVFVPALVLPRSGEDLAARKLILFASLAATLISAVWLAVRWDEAQRLVRLRAGKGIVARWTIDAERWEWFRRLSDGWDRLEGVRPNDVDFARPPGAAGSEVVVARDGLLVGAAFWPLEIDARITVRADWIEFHQTIPKADGQPFYTVLRLPLEPGKESLAAEVQQAYGREYRAAGSKVHQLVWIALLCFVGVPGAAALAWFIARITGWIDAG